MMRGLWRLPIDAVRWRRAAARIGIAAMLLQAALFGWHHHKPALPTLGGHAVAAVQTVAAPQPATDADGCEICSVLHHLTAAPADLPAALGQAPFQTAPIAGDADQVARTLALAFRARAPPHLA